MSLRGRDGGGGGGGGGGRLAEREAAALLARVDALARAAAVGACQAHLELDRAVGRVVGAEPVGRVARGLAVGAARDRARRVLRPRGRPFPL